MKISIHAAERFLERVMAKKSYNCFDTAFAMEYLEKLFKDVVVNSKVRYFVVPGFEHYRAVYKDDTIITIIPKEVFTCKSNPTVIQV